MSIVPEDGNVYRYVINELSSAVVAGGNYSVNLICKYAATPIAATDIIAYHTALSGASYN